MSVAALPWLFTGLASGLQLVSGFQQAGAMEAQAAANAQAEAQRAAYNEQVLQRQAEVDLAEASRSARSETAIETERRRRALATQRAQGGASGRAGGSLLDVWASSEVAARSDLLTIRQNQEAERRAIQLRRNTDIAGTRYGAQQNIWSGLTSARIGASQARTAGLFGAVGTRAGSQAVAGLLED